MNVNCIRYFNLFRCTLNGGSGKCFTRSEFNSAISLKSLYPNSSLKLTTPSPSQIPECAEEKFSGYIPEDKLDISYGLSYAPGGHPVYTKVTVKFHVESADWLHPNIKQRLLKEKKTSLTKEGYYFVNADKTRSRSLNLADALHRIRTVLYRVSNPQEECIPDSEERCRKKKEKEVRERLKMKSFFE